MAIRNNSRLFPNAARSEHERRRQNQAREILERMNAAVSSPDARTLQQVEQGARELARMTGGSGASSRIASGFGRSLTQAVESIEKYSRSSQLGMLGKFLRAIGSPGNMIASWLRGSEGQAALKPIKDQVRDALTVIGQVHPEIGIGEMSPEDAGGRLIPGRPGDGGADAGGGGGRNRLPPQAPSGAGPADDDDSPHPNVRILPDGKWRIRGPGYRRDVEPDHPMLLGRMVPVTSSNVHSIGYEFNFDAPTRGSLIVRYLQKDRNGRASGKVAGPTYEYLRVHPDLFDDLLKAARKGVWIWDEIRIRGTVAGHQYSYNLTRAAQNYLPRRARVVSGRQVLERRKRTAQRRDGSTYTLVSPNPTQYIGAYRPAEKRPNVGNPDRGNVRLRR